MGLNTCRRHPDSGLNTFCTTQFLTHPNTAATKRIRDKILLGRNVFRHHHPPPKLQEAGVRSHPEHTMMHQRQGGRLWCIPCSVQCVSQARVEGGNQEGDIQHEHVKKHSPCRSSQKRCHSSIASWAAPTPMAGGHGQTSTFEVPVLFAHIATHWSQHATQTQTTHALCAGNILTLDLCRHHFKTLGERVHQARHYLINGGALWGWRGRKTRTVVR